MVCPGNNGEWLDKEGGVGEFKKEVGKGWKKRSLFFLRFMGGRMAL